MKNFIFGKTQSAKTPEELDRQRRIVEALMLQNPHPKTIGEGLSAIGDALGARGASQQLSQDEAATMAAGNAAFNSYFPAQSPTALDTVKGALNSAPPTVAPPDQNYPEYGNTDFNVAPLTRDGPHFHQTAYDKYWEGVDNSLASQGWTASKTPPPQPMQTAQNPYNGVDPRLMQVMQNPYLNEGQKAVLQTIMKQQMEAADPSNQVALEKSRLELDKLRHPQQTYDTQVVNGRILRVPHDQLGSVVDATPNDLPPNFRPMTPEEKQMYPQYDYMTPEGPKAAPKGTTINLTEGQRSASVLWTAVKGDWDYLNQNWDALADETSHVGSAIEDAGVGAIGRSIQTPEYQSALDSVRNIISAEALVTSGKTLNEREITIKLDTMIPKMGDSPERRLQKKLRVKAAIDAIQQATGAPPPADGSVGSGGYTILKVE